MNLYCHTPVLHYMHSRIIEGKCNTPVSLDIFLKRVARAGFSRRVQHGLHGAPPQNQPCFQRPHAALPQARCSVHLRVLRAQCFIIIQMCSNCPPCCNCFRQWHQHLQETTNLQTRYLFIYNVYRFSKV